MVRRGSRGRRTADGQTDGVSALEAMRTQRAVRHFRSEPIGLDVIESLIFHATRAPSAGNRQPWEFVVVTDSSRRRQVAEIYRTSSFQLFKALVEGATDEQSRRVYRDALYLSEHLDEAPVLILVCVHVPTPRSVGQQLASVYPAAQNLMLAARAHGLGTVLTTIHKRSDIEVKELLSIPDDVETVCLIPVGYPSRPEQAFRPVSSRRAVRDVLHWEQFHS